MSPRISAAYQLVAAQAVLMAAGKTYTMGLWMTDPGNQAPIASIGISGSTLTFATTGAHGLTTGAPTAMSGIVSSGAGAHPLAALLNGVSVVPTVVDSTHFTITAPGSVTATDTYTGSGIAGGGGEVSGGSYARQTMAFSATAPTVSSTAQINFVNMPAVAAPGAGPSTLYGVIFDNTPTYVDAGPTNIANSVAIVAGSTVQIASGQVVGAFS